MALTRIKLSSIIVPSANVGTVLTVQSGGVVTANTVVASGVTSSDEIDGFLLAGM